jgi:5-methyltetrahydrofolate--homocysteine methyltransferase
MKELEINAIDITEALYYMGFRGNTPDEPMMSAIKRCETALLPVLSPRYIMKVADINCDLLVGDDIKEFTAGCEKAVFFCVTLGASVDRRIDLLSITSPSDALITDSLANAAVEQCCDMVEKIIVETFADYTHTERYSPGYGDYPLEMQPRILAFLAAERQIGVRAGESLMMSPLKSVSAVVGLKRRKL